MYFAKHTHAIMWLWSTFSYVSLYFLVQHKLFMFCVIIVAAITAVITNMSCEGGGRCDGMYSAVGEMCATVGFQNKISYSFAT